MGTNQQIKLPEGFIIDKQPSPPPGYVLDYREPIEGPSVWDHVKEGLKVGGITVGGMAAFTLSGLAGIAGGIPRNP